MTCVKSPSRSISDGCNSCLQVLRARSGYYSHLQCCSSDCEPTRQRSLGVAVCAQFEYKNKLHGGTQNTRLALRVPRAPPPPVITQRPGAASAAGPPAGGAATVTILPTVLAALSCRSAAAAPPSPCTSGGGGAMAPVSWAVLCWFLLGTLCICQMNRRVKAAQLLRVAPPHCIMHMQ